VQLHDKRNHTLTVMMLVRGLCMCNLCTTATLFQKIYRGFSVITWCLTAS
jgi:hypothetical protein